MFATHTDKTLAGVDFIAALSTIGSAAGWLWGVLPGFISILVGIAALSWYILQIHDSPRFQHWLRTRHRRKLRKYRLKHGHLPHDRHKH